MEFQPSSVSNRNSDRHWLAVFRKIKSISDPAAVSPCLNPIGNVPIPLPPAIVGDFTTNVLHVAKSNGVDLAWIIRKLWDLQLSPDG